MQGNSFPIALSGYQFFFVTKGMILTLAGTILSVTTPLGQLFDIFYTYQVTEIIKKLTSA